MSVLRQELQEYLNSGYKGAKVEKPHSIFGNIHIRFELGGDEMFRIIRNGIEIKWWEDRSVMTKADKTNHEKHRLERTRQAADRANTLFFETFSNLENELWMIIYEYEEGLFNHPNDFLRSLFPENITAAFHDSKEKIDTKMITENDDGTFTHDKTEARLIVGKLKVKDIPAEKIFAGIANNEMGFMPAISEEVYFLDPISNSGFHMYDDRGCFVWSDHADKIRHLYNSRNNWIVDYHRPEIDPFFD